VIRIDLIKSEDIPPEIRVGKPEYLDSNAYIIPPEIDVLVFIEIGDFDCHFLHWHFYIPEPTWHRVPWEELPADQQVEISSKILSGNGWYRLLPEDARPPWNDEILAIVALEQLTS